MRGGGERKLLEVSAETSVMDPGAFSWANAAGGGQSVPVETAFYTFFSFN